MQKREYLSFSSLELFGKCQTAYKHKYLDETQGHETIQQPLILGSLMHVLLEYRLRDLLSIDDALQLCAATWVESNCGLKVADSEERMNAGKGIYLPALINYAWEVSGLLLRCAPNYRGKDAIRNQDGTPPKDPIAFPSKAWKEAYSELEVSEDRYMIDIIATQLNPDFKALSLANIAAWAVMMARNFKKPKEVMTVGVEDEFGKENPVYTEGYWWKGAKDWTADLPEGLVPGVDGKARAIFDHKSGKKEFAKVAIRQHPQLNLYAWLEYETTGRLPDVIGISQPYFGRLTYEPVNIDNVFRVKEWVTNQAKTLNAAIETETFSQHHPNEYNSPCINGDWKTGLINSSCPYLAHCWPGYAADLSEFEGIEIQAH
jgi:hypothetical protein